MMKRAIASTSLRKGVVVKWKRLGYHYCNDSSDEQLNSSSYVNIVPKTYTALELIRIYEDKAIMKCKHINSEFYEFLNDELIPGAIIELVGLPGCGRTQISFDLCAFTHLKHECNKFAAFISTNQSFSLMRFKEIALNLSRNSHQSIDLNRLCDGTLFTEASTYSELLQCLQYLGNLIKTVGSSINLIVIDSISYPLKRLFGGDRTKAVHGIFRILRQLSANYDLSIVLTNDLTTMIDNNEQGSSHTPSFGNSFYHYVTTRLELSRNDRTIDVEVRKTINSSMASIQFHL